MSTLDMHLRAILLPMCIDIEHALKVKIIAEIEANSAEDGYSIVDDFLATHSDILHSIEEKADSIFTGELIEKYFQLCNVVDLNTGRIYTRILSVDCPAWVFVEIIGFRNLIFFIDYYRKRYPGSIRIDKNIINPVRSLRNACAHNNCLLNSIRPQKTQPPEAISSFVKGIPSVFKEERKNKLSCRPIFEIVCLLYIYNDVVSENVKRNRLHELHTFTSGRLMKNAEYFTGNQVVLTSFAFIQKVVDNLI
jgi:abortive infection bacteriophage resistance protein